MKLLGFFFVLICNLIALKVIAAFAGNNTAMLLNIPALIVVWAISIKKEGWNWLLWAVVIATALINLSS